MAGIVHEVENHRLVEQAERRRQRRRASLAEIAHLRRRTDRRHRLQHERGRGPSGRQLVDAGDGGASIFRGLSCVFSPMGVYLAAQCASI